MADQLNPVEIISGVLIGPSVDAERENARKILTALEVAGYAVVPAEATEEMIGAIRKSDWPERNIYGHRTDNLENECSKNIWAAMLEAAPKWRNEITERDKVAAKGRPYSL